MWDCAFPWLQSSLMLMVSRSRIGLVPPGRCFTLQAVHLPASSRLLLRRRRRRRNNTLESSLGLSRQAPSLLPLRSRRMRYIYSAVRYRESAVRYRDSAVHRVFLLLLFISPVSLRAPLRTRQVQRGNVAVHALQLGARFRRGDDCGGRRQGFIGYFQN